MRRVDPILNAGKAISEPAVFVTGTDTGVGKTVVSALLATAAAARGAQSGYLKPVQTGVLPRSEARDPSHPLPGLERYYASAPDEAFVRATAAAGGYTVATRTTYTFALPASPELAARHEGTEVDLAKIAADFEALQAACDYVVVEGAGGLLVPLTGEATMADLASRLGLPLVIVARPSLGTLNHTLLTVEAAHRRGLSVLGIAIGRMPSEPDVVTADNLETLRSLTGLEVLLSVPDNPSIDVEAGSPGSLVDLAVQIPRGFSSPKKV